MILYGVKVEVGGEYCIIDLSDYCNEETFFLTEKEAIKYAEDMYEEIGEIESADMDSDKYNYKKGNYTIYRNFIKTSWFKITTRQLLFDITNIGHVFKSGKPWVNQWLETEKMNKSTESTTNDTSYGCAIS